MSDDDTPLLRHVTAKAARKLKAQGTEPQTVWFGLGMIGLIGWSVAVPTLLGIALGSWLDRHHPEAHSWLLWLLFAGLIIGCINAWHWVSREHEAMHDGPDDTRE
jgi:ATP synthase protein I